MPNLNERASQIWDRTTSLMANKEARASFLQQVDKDGDGKVTAAEIRKMADENQDGYLDSGELERLAIKATASDFDRTTIKAMAQAGSVGPQLVLFEVETPKPIEAPKPVEPPAGPLVPGIVGAEAPKTSDSSVTPTATEPSETPPADAASTEAAAPAAPPEPALKIWKTAEGLEQVKDSYRTTINYQPGDALPSRNPEALKVVKPGLFHLQEQVGNSCGTTSLSMVLKYWQGHTLENTVTTIDKHIRAQGSLELNLPGGKKSIPIDGFTSARDIVDYAKTHGMRAGMKNQASVDDLKAYLDKGIPLMTLTDWNYESGSGSTQPSGGKPDGKSLHWVDIIGYEYKTNPETKKQEMYLKVGNPWGIVQDVSATDFTKIWSKLSLEIPGGKRVDTGMDRLFVALVPRDDDKSIVAPNGKVSRAGDISLPMGDDGIKGWLAQKTSDVLQDVSAFQTKIGNKRAQLSSEMSAGYDQKGIGGALKNLWSGDQRALDALRSQARQGSVETKSAMLKGLMEKQVNRANIQQLMFDILRDTPDGKDFNRLLETLDTNQLAERLTDDQQAGQVLSRIAKSEIGSKGVIGPKFESFASQLALKHRSVAINGFLNDPYVVQNKVVQKIPASLVRDAINRLMQGITTTASESSIHQLIQGTSWNQFDQITARLNMAQVASEISDAGKLGDITSKAIQQGILTGNWNSTSEILNRLDSITEYSRADDVLAKALNQPEVKSQLGKIPAYLRIRMIDLLDDFSRGRSDQALKALAALKKQ